MRILLVESTPGNATQFQAWLDENGHETIRCFTDADQRTCRGVHDAEACPFERHVDAALVVRDLDERRTLAEMGAVCAQRHRAPVVEVYECTDPTTALPGAFEPALFAAEDATYGEAIRRALLASESVTMEQVERLVIDVHRTPDRVEATVDMPWLEQSARGQMADRIGRALRRHDPFAKSIDVSIT
jgi:hypothetical protein